VPWWTWLSLGVFLLALVATAVFSVMAFRRLGQLSALASQIQSGVDQLARDTEEMNRRLAHAQERMEELERHRARTEASVARLKVLTSALSEALGGPRGLQRRYLRK
jgi:septal ring factor EnvC (AmiA/AmiB activator)